MSGSYSSHLNSGGATAQTRIPASPAWSAMRRMSEGVHSCGPRPYAPRTSMAGATSTVEFEADVTHKQEEAILNQLNRQGVITEVAPVEGHQE